MSETADTHPAVFRNSLVMETDHGQRKLGACCDPWQLKDFAALDDGWRQGVFGAGFPAKYQRAWLERPRGHSKTTDIAVMVLWAIYAARKPIYGVCAAADRDQARLMRDAIKRLLFYNPWLTKFVEVQSNSVVNTHTGARLEIIASDVPSSYGITPDFIICDETTHWSQTQGQEMWNSLVSSAAKRSTCMLVVITNAGYEDDWQFAVRNSIAQVDSEWYFSRLDGPVASWLHKRTLTEQRRLLPVHAYNRLWGNQWQGGGGDALTQEDIDQAFSNDLDGPMTGFESDLWQYVAGLDLGIKRDHSALVVLAAKPNSGRIRLAHHERWAPADHGGQVDLQQVEDHVLAIDRKYRLHSVQFDPSQALGMAQRLELATNHRRRDEHWFGPSWNKPTSWMTEVPATGKNLQEQASITIQAFRDHRLDLFQCDALRNDLLRLRCEEKSYGYRLTSPRDGSGHGDSASAFLLALPAIHKIAGSRARRLFIDEEEEQPITF